MEDIEKLVEELRKNRFDYVTDNNFSGGKATADGISAADALERLRAENERIRSNCYAKDAVQAIINERDELRAQLVASQRREQAAEAELCKVCREYGHYRYDCDKCKWRGPGAGEGEAE